MDASHPIVFYDISSGPPERCFAPNPWKTRYALNFKGVHYRTEWVDLPDISSIRQKLGAAPNRTLPDGSPFYTLPIIVDSGSSSSGDQHEEEIVVGDSFEIARYLDTKYSLQESGSGSGSRSKLLFPPSTTGLMAAFNIQVDAIFTAHVVLCAHGMPMNPATREKSRAEFLRRAGKQSWDDLAVEGDDRKQKLENFRIGLDPLAKMYANNNGETFLCGSEITYADIIVGAWLMFMKATLREEEWRDILTWHDGLWKRIHEALDVYADLK